MNTRSKSGAGIYKHTENVHTPAIPQKPAGTAKKTINVQPVTSSLRSLGGSRRFYGSVNVSSGTVRNGTVAIPQALATLSADPEIIHFRLSTSKCRLFRVSWDKGWGCSYRCIQSLYSVLVQTDPYKRGLPFSFTYQNIPFIQEDIEKAWNVYKIDECGGATFDNALKGKKDWIGAAEVASLLRSHSINAELHDFYFNSTGTKHANSLYHKRLVDFVKDYFEWGQESSNAGQREPSGDEHVDPRNQSKRGFVMENKLPLYFQTNGHSMIIVGLVQYKNHNYGLALYDSQESSKVPRIMRASSLKDPVYQVLKINGILETAEMKEQAKILIGIPHFS